MISTDNIFIGGCESRFELISLRPFNLRLITDCESRYLQGITTQFAAIHACNACKYRIAPPHVTLTNCQQQEVAKLPVVGNLGVDPMSAMSAEFDGRSTKIIPELKDDEFILTAENACIELPVPKIEREREFELLVKPESLAVSSRLAQLPIFDDSKIGNSLIEDVIATFSNGPTIMGSSKIRVAQHCLQRFYYQYVLGLARTRDEITAEEDTEEKIEPADFSNLVHILYETHLHTGGRNTWQVLYALKGRYPTAVLELYNIFSHYMKVHYGNDVIKYDYRAVEQESRWYCKSRKVQGANISLMLTSRHDALIHELQRGEKRQAPGMSCSSIFINDLKVYKILPTNIAGIRLDMQTALHLWTARYGHAVINGKVVEESTSVLYGDVRSIIYDYLSKLNKNATKRFKFNVSDEQLAEQIAVLEDFVYTMIADRLFSKHVDESGTWPRSYWCRDVYFPGWLCPYYLLCDTCAEHKRSSAYKKDPRAFLVTRENICYDKKPRPARNALRGKLFGSGSKVEQDKNT